MNREILFRGKRIDNGEWVYGLFCECPCDDGTDIQSIMRIESKGSHRIFMQYPIISETRGQYTGLTDRNGRRIFEGDLIRSKKTINKKSFAIVKYGAFIPKFFYDCVEEAKNIKLSNKIIGFYCENPKTQEQLYLTDYTPNIFEIIGNIHDNPEMLGGERNESSSTGIEAS